MVSGHQNLSHFFPSLCALLFFAAPLPGYGDGSRLLNYETLREIYGITEEYKNLAGLERMAIAEIDSGYQGLEDLEHQKYLPPSLVDLQATWPWFTDEDKSQAFKHFHGRMMAQIFYGMFGFYQGGPTYILLNGGKSLSAFKDSLKYISDRTAEKNIRMIGYSGTFPCCSNMDGTGSLPFSIRQNLKPDQIFLVSSGDYGRKCYNGSIVEDANHYVRFRNGKNKLRIQTRYADTPVTITLLWTGTDNDFRVGSKKDLNLYLQDPEGKLVASGTNKQVEKYSADPRPPEESRLLREEITLRLDKTKIDSADPAKNTYYTLYVTVEGGEFTPNDRLRILLKSNILDQENLQATNIEEPVAFAEGDGTANEEVNTPGDMEEIVTVGDVNYWSSQGPTYDGRWKPDVVAPLSHVEFDDGFTTAATSQARAILTAVGTYLYLADPRLRAEDFRKFVEIKHYPPSQNAKYPREEQPIPLGPDYIPVSLRKETNESPRIRVIVERVRDFLNDEPIAAWRSPDGHLVLGIAESAAEIKKEAYSRSTARHETTYLFPFFHNEEIPAKSYDLFSTFLYATDVSTESQRKADPLHAQLDLYSYIRNRRKEGWKKPWESVGGLPEDYVEIRRIPLMRDGIVGVLRDGGWVHNVWKTPTIEKLKEVIEKRLAREDEKARSARLQEKK